MTARMQCVVSCSASCRCVSPLPLNVLHCMVPTLKAAIQCEVHLNTRKSCSNQESNPHPRCDL